LWHLLLYERESTAWQETLSNRAIHIAESLTTDGLSRGYKTDLAIITAQKAIELDAVLNLPGDWVPRRIDGDDTIYHSGVFSSSNGKLSVIAAAAIGMGMPAAACLTMKLIGSFRPRYLIMTGITAGIGANFGDIIVADQSWDYGSGKLFADGD